MIVAVLKHEGTVRLYCDYKIRVNPRLEVPKYPLLRIECLFAIFHEGI